MPYLKKNVFGVTFVIILRVMNAPAEKLLRTATVLASDEATGGELAGPERMCSVKAGFPYCYVTL